MSESELSYSTSHIYTETEETNQLKEFFMQYCGLHISLLFPVFKSDALEAQENFLTNIYSIQNHVKMSLMDY